MEFAPVPAFTETRVWKNIGTGWRPLFGDFHQLGFTFEWHEFSTPTDFNWGASFHPDSIEICLNLAGVGRITDGQQTLELHPQMVAFYFQGNSKLTATRLRGEKHRFITIEFSRSFLREHFQSSAEGLHPLARAVVAGEATASQISRPELLTMTLQQMVENLRQCPVYTPAQEIWFRSKALEIGSHLFFHPATTDKRYSRTQRLARERVEKAMTILREQMQKPPSLNELARMMNCSPYYLSRQFAQAGGMTMQQYLRQIRMERAAELLRTGKCNVTEAAYEVGYNSLSHFSSAFHEMFGCCPGLYPLQNRVR